ncbi:ferredoxin [Streptosporangium sandarakinum]
MRIVVDLNRCEAYAQCAFQAPDVFAMHGEEALMYEPCPGDERREQVMRAAVSCPVQAILVEWPGGPAVPEEAGTGARG